MTHGATMFLPPTVPASIPLANQPQAVAAGQLLYRDHCAQCHGVEATGRHNHPSLRTERVALATDGELAWLLKNGNTWKGMPSWSSLPEQQRWQILAFLRSLPAPAMPTSSTPSSTRNSTNQPR